MITWLALSGILTTVFGSANSLATFMQAARMVRTKSAHDVSETFIGVRTCAFLASFNYGVVLGNKYLIIPAVIGIVASTVTILIARHYTVTATVPERM